MFWSLHGGNTISESPVLINEKPVRSSAIHCAFSIHLRLSFKISEM